MVEIEVRGTRVFVCTLVSVPHGVCSTANLDPKEDRQKMVVGLRPRRAGEGTTTEDGYRPRGGDTVRKRREERFK